MKLNKKYDEIVSAESISSYKRSLAFQRERFKSGKDGSGINNFDMMCDALENLKSDLKFKIIAKGGKKQINRIEKVITWYKTLETNPKYIKNTPEGIITEFPETLKHKINKFLTKAYEIIVEETSKLGLLE